MRFFMTGREGLFAKQSSKNRGVFKADTGDITQITHKYKYSENVFVPNYAYTYTGISTCMDIIQFIPNGQVQNTHIQNIGITKKLVVYIYVWSLAT